MELKRKTINTLQREAGDLKEFVVWFAEWLEMGIAETPFQEALDDVFEQTGDGTETLIYSLKIYNVQFKEVTSDNVKVEFDK